MAWYEIKAPIHTWSDLTLRFYLDTAITIKFYFTISKSQDHSQIVFIHLIITRNQIFASWLLCTSEYLNGVITAKLLCL